MLLSSAFDYLIYKLLTFIYNISISRLLLFYHLRKKHINLWVSACIKIYKIIKDQIIEHPKVV